MRDCTEADDIVQGAYNRALLDLILPPMRRAAKTLLAWAGKNSANIDLSVVPFIEETKP